MMLSTNMDTAIIVAIGVLGTIFIASLVGLILVCKFRYCKSKDLITQQHAEHSADHTLVDHMEEHRELPSGVELVGFNLDQILGDDDWVNDATGLTPHCLAILKTCHRLTEKLVGMTMGGGGQQGGSSGHQQQPLLLSAPDTLAELVSVAKRIGPRVDDVVKALYPPLDPRLLEARCTSLVLSVHHLVLITKLACQLAGVQDWIDQSLADVEDHLQVLREASHNFHQNCPSPTSASVASAPAGSSQSEASLQTGQNSPQHSEEARV